MSCIVNICIVSVHLIDCTRARVSRKDAATLDGHCLQASACLLAGSCPALDAELICLESLP